jgi:gliding motility-associated transport system ATP-binding protein
VITDAVSNEAAEPSAMAVPLIEVQGLCRAYGSLLAVRDLSFSVGRGEVVGFLGPNGAGKSTTLRMIAGYLGPSSGRVRVNGFDVVEQPLLARQAMGYMAETAPLYPEMRVSEYLLFRARLKGIQKRDIRGYIDQAVQKSGIAEVLRSLIGTLSRGFRQRVALADALLGNPPLLILDEPTAGLDPNQIHHVREVIRELSELHTVLLSTHILSEVESTCSRAIVIDRGVLVAEGPITELRRRRGSQRAVLTVHDLRQQALAVMASSELVQGVASVTTTPSMLPQRPSSASIVPRERRSSPGAPPSSGPGSSRAGAPGSARGNNLAPQAFPNLAGQDAIVSFLVSFAPAADAHECLEELVALLVQSGIRVREARLEHTSLEEVFRQLTGADLADVADT